MMISETAQCADVDSVATESLPTPIEVKRSLPLTAKAKEAVARSRATLCRILDRDDDRLFVVVGPCSIHDLQAAREYAYKLKGLADELSDTLVILMRVYFEKPRSALGWKGLINDPHLNGSFRIDEGIVRAREFLLELAELGLPAGTEVLDPVMPHYLSDLVAWSAIGARTAESQPHREVSSGLPIPVGFKNSTDGNLQVAVNAMLASSCPHHFLGVDQFGRCSIHRTRGNRYGHIILRGGASPNHHSTSIDLCERQLTKAGLPQRVVVDCSHGNSGKDPARQTLVLEECLRQIAKGARSLVGFMIESNLEWGNQPLSENPAQLRYGVSVTDSCVDWKTTEEMLYNAREKLEVVRAQTHLVQT